MALLLTLLSVIIITVHVEIRITLSKNAAGHCTKGNVAHLQLQLAHSWPVVFKRHLEQQIHYLSPTSYLTV